MKIVISKEQAKIIAAAVYPRIISYLNEKKESEKQETSKFTHEKSA